MLILFEVLSRGNCINRQHICVELGNMPLKILIDHILTGVVSLMNKYFSVCLYTCKPACFNLTLIRSKNKINIVMHCNKRNSIFCNILINIHYYVFHNMYL